MEILPAWLIEELKKLEELKRQHEERPRVYIEPPPPYPPRSKTEENEIEQETEIKISLR